MRRLRPTILALLESELTGRAGECYHFVRHLWWGLAGGVVVSLFPLFRLLLTKGFGIRLKLTGGWG